MVVGTGSALRRLLPRKRLRRMSADPRAVVLDEADSYLAGGRVEKWLVGLMRDHAKTQFVAASATVSHAVLDELRRMGMRVRMSMGAATMRLMPMPQAHCISQHSHSMREPCM